MIRRVALVVVAVVVLVAAAAFLISIFSPPPRTAAVPDPVAAPSRAPDVPAAPAAAPSAPPSVPRSARSAPEPALGSASEAPPPAVIEEAAPEAGTLRIQSDVPGAQVFIDRQFVGATPVTAENVKPGTHQLNISAEGFDSVVQTIEVAPGERDIAIKFREVRLDLRADVIHKHGMGSCRGRLVATAQGLRYETSDKNDAFTASLTALETFQVDYLEKNLRVKLPKGRQFNFTDPEGNADRLFVFHRDVEKARERLRKGDTPATN